MFTLKIICRQICKRFSLLKQSKTKQINYGQVEEFMQCNQCCFHYLLLPLLMWFRNKLKTVHDLLEWELLYSKDMSSHTHSHTHPHTQNLLNEDP